jgi:NTP-dependent ternary system trypsin peptidase co-occuring protein
MTELLVLPLQDGGTVVVEINDAGRGPVTRGGGRREELVTDASETFEQALDRVLPALRSLAARVSAAAQGPDEFTIEFGLRLSAELGAIVAKTAGEANFSVSATWKRDAGLAPNPATEGGGDGA